MGVRGSLGGFIPLGPPRKTAERKGCAVKSCFRIFVGILPFLFIASLTSGCAGYRFTDDSTYALAPEYRKLFIESVDNPTLMSDLEFRLRSLVRDELTGRGLVTWTPKETAAAAMRLRIVDFRSNTLLEDAEEETVKSVAFINLQAEIRSRKDNKILWESGRISRSLSFFDGEQVDTEDRVLEFAVRELADRLRYAF